VSTLELPGAPRAVVVKGPSALAGDPRRFLTLTWTMAVLEFRLRFFGSVLGYVWQLMRPLLLFGVIYVVFSVAFKLADDVAFYPATLLTNIVLYTFFADATGAAVLSVLERENIVRKIDVPRLAIPASVVVTALFNLLLNLCAVGIFLIGSGVRPHWGWLQMPVLLGILVMFALGVAMSVSALFVRFRDVKPIWDVLLQIIFYASPVLWVLEKVPHETVKAIILHGNPLAPLMQQVRHALIDPNVPSAAASMGGWPHLLAPLGIVLLVFVGGFAIFTHEAPRIAEDL
jgi:ABC-2 type transport system permease protein